MDIGSNGLRDITNSERRFSNYKKEVDDIKVEREKELTYANYKKKKHDP